MIIKETDNSIFTLSDETIQEYLILHKEFGYCIGKLKIWNSSEMKGGYVFYPTIYTIYRAEQLQDIVDFLKEINA